MAVLLAFLAGLGLGILLNSLADSLPPDTLGVRRLPRLPRCLYCGATHALAYWLALASLLAHGGRCEHCGGPRPRRQAMVEGITGIGLAYAWHWAGGSAGKFLAAAVITAIFILVAVIDIEHRLILHAVSLPAALIIGIIGFFTPGQGVVKTLLGGLAGYALTLGIFLLGLVLSAVIGRVRGRASSEVAFGAGDVNLAGVVGLSLGWPNVVQALLITAIANGVFSLGYILVQLLRRRYQPFTPLPFGPFLVLGALSVYFGAAQFTTPVY